MGEITDYLKLPYTIILRPDDEGDWIAEVDELEGCVAHGATQEEALRRLEEAKTLWIEESLGAGQPPPEPNVQEALPSGKWVQRVPRSLHLNLVRLAKVEGVSLNQLVAIFCAERVGIPMRDVSRKRESAWSALEERFEPQNIDLVGGIGSLDPRIIESVPTGVWEEDDLDAKAKAHKHR